MYNNNAQNNARPGPSSQPLQPRPPHSHTQPILPRQSLSHENKPELAFGSASHDEDEDVFLGDGEGYSDQEGDGDLDQDMDDGTANAGGSSSRSGGGGVNGNDGGGASQTQKKRRTGGGPGSRGGGANEGKGGSGIVRVNRACTNCRRMKMRCVGGESPPCKRCSHTGQTCVMQKPNKPGPVSGGGGGRAESTGVNAAGGGGTGAIGYGRMKEEAGGVGMREDGRWDGVAGEGEGYARSPDGDDRIRHLESQMSSMQNTLLDLVSSIRASSALNPSPHPQQHSTSSSSVYEHISPASVTSLAGHGPGPTHRMTPPVGGMTGYHGTVDGSYGQTGTATSSGGEATLLGQNVTPATLLARTRIPSGTIPTLDSLPSMENTPYSSLGGMNVRQTPPTQSYMPPMPAYNDFSTAGNEFMEQALNLGPSPLAGPSRTQSVGGGGGNRPSNSGDGWPFRAGQGPPPSRGTSVDVGSLSRSNYTSYPAGPGPSPISTKQSHLRSTPVASGDNSPALSDNEDEDPLGPTSIMAPLSSMAGLAEAAAAMGRMDANQKGKQAARGGEANATTGNTAANARPPDEESSPRASKKRKLTDGTSTRSVAFATPAVPEYALVGPKKDKVQIGNSPIVELPVITEFVRTARGKEVRRHVHAFPDVIALGLVAETEAKELFQLFFEGCHAFIPIFDLDRDNWDSMRDRSPFLITSIVAIGARVRDGGGPVSETQRIALDHARKIAISTLFTAVHRVEAIQAMILISAFNDTGWVPANYTGLLAIDMGLNKCFIKLLQTGMGSGKLAAEVEDDRDLVIGSRAWLCLYMIEHQMAFGTGRPVLLREDECITRCRMLLQHPLSIPSDVRLVSTVELMALRAPLHVVLTNSPDQPVDQATVLRLQQANADFDRWQAHWDRVLSERFSIDRTDFYRESLAAQREYSSLFINSQLLRGVREAADVKRMPEDKRELALRAMRNAQACLEIALRANNYRQALKFAVHYTHVCAAFAASFLVRIARLFPKELDLRKTAKDVEELASVLAEIPAGRYSRSLRLILRRARKQKVMPPPTAPSSPTRAAAHPLPSQPSQLDQSVSSLMSSTTPNPNSNPAIPQMSPAYSHASPGSLLAQMGKNPPQDSPSSNPEAWQQYDFDFAQELWNKAGVRDGADEQLPLYLNGESLGNMDTLNPAFGLENFFVPPDIDMRLGDLGAFPEGLQSMPWPVPSPQQDAPPDTWW